MKLTILVGPPGSGKTTIAHSMRGYGRVSQDDHGKEEHHQLFLQMLERQDDIVIDRMNFSKEQRARFIKPAREAGYSVEIRVFAMGYQDCLVRMASRFDGRQSHPTIKNEENERNALKVFFTKFERPTGDEADTIEWTYQTDSSVPCVVVDLDGTMCNIDHRLHHVKEKPKDWIKFFKECANDKMNLWCMELCIAMANRGYEIVFASGRAQDQCEAETKKWLDERCQRYGVSYSLFMRHGTDFRRDDVVKEIILDFEILPKFEPLFVVDDRDQVVRMWRKRGLTCLQCAPGDF